MKNYCSRALYKAGSFISFVAVALALTVVPGLTAQHTQASSSQDSYTNVNLDSSDSVYACWR